MEQCLCWSLDSILSENRFQLPSCRGEQIYISPLHSAFNCRALRVRFQFEVRSKSHLRLKSCSNEINCIVIRKPAHIKGMSEEGVPQRIYQRKLINHRKWNEHTRDSPRQIHGAIWRSLWARVPACTSVCRISCSCGYILVKPERIERDALKGLFVRWVGIQGWLLNNVIVRITL